jgi:hypothetical protein
MSARSIDFAEYLATRKLEGEDRQGYESSNHATARAAANVAVVVRMTLEENTRQSRQQLHESRHELF